MDLGQIEAFVQVAQHRSFSKAAESLFLTQPSVTARIQSLERDLGEALFERNGRGVRLTEMGASFLPYARRALKALQDGRDAIEGMRNLEIGTLKLGSALTVSTYVLPKILKRYCSTYPGVEVSVHTGRSEQVLQMVLNDDVHCALERTVHHPEIVTVPLYEDDLLLVAAPQHRFARTGSAAIEDVGREPLILFDKGSSYNALIQGVFRQHGIVPHMLMELDTIEATKKMVEEGLGIALLPKVSVERELEMGTLASVEVANASMPRRQISLIYRKNRKHLRSVQAFFTLLADLYGVRLPDAALSAGVA
ncbi:MAG TPA: LysR family transcriptional regulator [Dehalococcoidia bacterium]|jgi:DNA-binding transcriptional LysR family regulator|nr:LysR family transcriptional regulator [Dehalococcoidia bacterium]